MRIIRILAVVCICVGIAILAAQGLSAVWLRRGEQVMPPPAGQHLQPEKKKFSVAVFSDFAGQMRTVEEVERYISRSDAAFALCLGDMVSSPSDADFLLVQKEIRKNLKTALYAIPGNWDRDAARQWQWRLFQRHFGADYYYFGYGDTLFIGLNNADGTLPDAQRAFLERTLKMERDSYARCVIFLHVPPVNPNLPGRHQMGPPHAEALAKIIAPHRVDLLVSGHVHRFTESEFAGVRQITTPSSGQAIRDPNNQMFGCLMLDFADNGKISVRRIDVTSDTDAGSESAAYFFYVQFSRIGWSIGAAAAILAGVLLLWIRRRQHEH